MKRVIAFLLVCMFVVIAGACGGAKKPATTTAPTEDLTVSVSPTDEPMDDPTEEPVDDPTDEPTEEPTEEPAEEPKDIKDSLVVSLKYDSNGKVSNGIANGPEIFENAGKTVPTQYDSSLGRYVSNLTGGSNACYVFSLADLYNTLTQSLTVEYYVNITGKVTETATIKYYSLGDSFEGGGFGCEVYNNYKLDTSKTAGADEVVLQASCHIDGAYKITEVPVKMNKWNHIVMNWDGSRIGIYLNGELFNEFETDWANLTYPANPAAHHFTIGGCCSAKSGNSYGGATFQGQIAGFNLYTQAMQEHEVAAAYQAMTGK